MYRRAAARSRPLGRAGSSGISIQYRAEHAGGIHPRQAHPFDIAVGRDQRRASRNPTETRSPRSARTRSHRRRLFRAPLLHGAILVGCADSCQGIRSPSHRRHAIIWSRSEPAHLYRPHRARRSEPVIAGFPRATSPDGAITLMLSDVADADSVADRIGPDRWNGAAPRSPRGWSSAWSQTTTAGSPSLSGDGFFASFNSAHAGLAAAVELQRESATSPAPPTSERRPCVSACIRGL